MIRSAPFASPSRRQKPLFASRSFSGCSGSGGGSTPRMSRTVFLCSSLRSNPTISLLRSTPEISLSTRKLVTRTFRRPVMSRCAGIGVVMVIFATSPARAAAGAARQRAATAVAMAARPGNLNTLGRRGRDRLAPLGCRLRRGADVFGARRRRGCGHRLPAAGLDGPAELQERFIVVADLLAVGGETACFLVFLAGPVELSETLGRHGQVVVHVRVVGIGLENLLPPERRLTPQSPLRRFGAEAHLLLEIIMPGGPRKERCEKDDADKSQGLRSHGRAPGLPSGLPARIGPSDREGERPAEYRT